MTTRVPAWAKSESWTQFFGIKNQSWTHFFVCTGDSKLFHGRYYWRLFAQHTSVARPANVFLVHVLFKLTTSCIGDRTPALT